MTVRKSKKAIPEIVSRPAIRLRGGRAHNLKSVDVDVPLGSLTVICGVSGSGKTSLAFDTLYAEGQRRYIESFSSYARQFLERLDRPEYDTLENLPPAIAVSRKGASRNNRSIVSSSAEIDDYLRLLFAKIAELRCIDCGHEVIRQNASNVLAWTASLPTSIRAMVSFTLKWDDATDLALQLAHLQSSGFVRIIVAEKSFSLSDDDRTALVAAVNEKSEVAIVVDRLQMGQDLDRWSEALETAFAWGEGKAELLVLKDPEGDILSELQPPAAGLVIDGRAYWQYHFHEDLICNHCGRQYPTPDQRLFSFNSPIGACERCEGLAEVQELDMKKIVPDESKSLRQGAIAPWTTPAYSHELDELLALAKSVKLDVDAPYSKLTKSQRAIVMDGVPARDFGGLKGFFRWLEKKKYKMHIRIFAARWHSYLPCPQCNGQRLRPESLAFHIAGQNIAQLNAMTVGQLQKFLAELSLDSVRAKTASSIVQQLSGRLSYLADVGLEYLQLDRPLRTLSGGEVTRVNLTSVLGSNLVSMLYVLDEPTVGLHADDSQRLIDVICRLRDRGNTVLVVEHEPPLIEQADYLLEVGPLAGRLGGEIVFSGPPSQLAKAKTLTSSYLYDATRNIALRRNRAATDFITLSGACGHNLQNIDVEFPQQVFCVVSGVSGSGKSSLVNETFVPAIQQRLGMPTDEPLPFDKLAGSLRFDDCIMIDQGISGRSTRSVPVTMVKAFDEIRSLFSQTRDAVSRNMTPSNFSFNSAEGRCPKCEGIGYLEIDMIFLADVQVVCPDCHGQRFCPEVLAVRYRDRTISDVLRMSVQEANDFFRGTPKIQDRLAVLSEVGLDYIELGQPTSTLSAGESQRLRLANFLLNVSNRSTLIVMDEPTTGLHFYDVEKLIQCLQKLVDRGHSLIVVEHNEQFLNAADWIIDIGPGSATRGGRVVVAGPPSTISACKESKTGYFITQSLGQ